MAKGYTLILLTALVSGVSVFLNRFGVEINNPYVFTFLKNLLVAMVFSCLVFAPFKRKELAKLTKKQWSLLVLVGLVGGSIPFLLFFKGLSLTTAASGAFLHKTMFLYATVLAAVFLKEKIDKRFFLGAVFLLWGNALFLKGAMFYPNYGDFLILLAALLWAGENTLSKYLLRDLSAWVVAFSRMFFGSLFILAFLLMTSQFGLVFKLNSLQFSWILVTGLFLLMYVLSWYAGLKNVPLSQATVILLLGSPITSFLAFVQTGQISAREIIASIMVISGALLALGFKNLVKVQKQTNAFRA